MSYHLLEVEPNGTPKLSGPYPNAATRDLAARKIHNISKGGSAVYGLDTRRSYDHRFRKYEEGILDPEMPVIYVQTVGDNKPIRESKDVVIIGLKRKIIDDEIKEELEDIYKAALLRWGRVLGVRLPDV